MYPAQAGWWWHCHSSALAPGCCRGWAAPIKPGHAFPPPSSTGYPQLEMLDILPLCVLPHWWVRTLLNVLLKMLERCQGRRGCQCFCWCVGFLSLTRLCCCFGGIVGFGFVFFFHSVLECTIYFSRLVGKISCKLFLKTACFPCPWTACLFMNIFRLLTNMDSS